MWSYLTARGAGKWTLIVSNLLTLQGGGQQAPFLVSPTPYLQLFPLAKQAANALAAPGTSQRKNLSMGYLQEAHLTQAGPSYPEAHTPRVRPGLFNLSLFYFGLDDFWLGGCPAHCSMPASSWPLPTGCPWYLPAVTTKNVPRRFPMSLGGRGGCVCGKITPA